MRVETGHSAATLERMPPTPVLGRPPVGLKGDHAMQLGQNLAQASLSLLRDGGVLNDALVVRARPMTRVSRDFEPDVSAAVRVHPLEPRHLEVGPVGEQLEELPFAGEPLAGVCRVGHERQALAWQMGHPAPMVIGQ
jgi:hypothetical protein